MAWFAEFTVSVKTDRKQMYGETGHVTKAPQVHAKLGLFGFSGLHLKH